MTIALAEQQKASSPRIRELRVRTARVPLTDAHRTASGVVSESPLVLTDITLDDGTVGHSVVFTYTDAALKPTGDLIAALAPLIVDEQIAPMELEQKLARRFRLLLTQGLVCMALSAVDMALWYALARHHATSLVRLLGGVH